MVGSGESGWNQARKEKRETDKVKMIKKAHWRYRFPRFDLGSKREEKESERREENDKRVNFREGNSNVGTGAY